MTSILHNFVRPFALCLIVTIVTLNRLQLVNLTNHCFGRGRVEIKDRLLCAADAVGVMTNAVHTAGHAVCINMHTANEKLNLTLNPNANTNHNPKPNIYISVSM